MPDPDCANCPLRDLATDAAHPDRYVYGQPARNSRPSLTVIADQPLPGAMSGALPREVRQACNRLNRSTHGIHFDYAVACWMKDATPRQVTEATQCCARRLELPKGPKLAMGQHALWALRGHREHSKWRGARVGDVWVSDGLGALFAKPHLNAALVQHMRHAMERPFKWGRHYVFDDTKMRAALKELRNAPALAVDIETAGTDPLTAPMLCIGIGTRELVACVPWQTGGKEKKVHADTETLLRELLANNAVKIAHNGAHDFLGLEAAGLDVNGPRFDTLLAHAVVAPELPHGLQYVAGLNEPVEAWKGGFVTSADPDAKGHEVYSQRNEFELREYCAKDVASTAMLYDHLRAQLRAMEKGEYHYERLMHIGNICLKMQNKGMPLDIAQRDELHSFVVGQAHELKAQFESLAGGIDAGSEGTAGSVKHFFFKVLGAPVLATTKTGAPSLGKDVLKRYAADKELNPRIRTAARTLLKFKLYAKIASTFTGPECIEVTDGFCNPSWRPWGTISRRLSCVVPGTKVRTQRGTLAARDVRVGDKVYTHLRRWQPVTRVLDQGIQATLTFSLSNGRVLQCADDHRLWTTQGWKTAGEIYGDFQEVVSQRVQRRECVDAVRIWNEDEGYCTDVGNRGEDYQCSDTLEIISGGNSDAAQISLSTIQDGTSQSYVGQERRGAPQLQGGLRRRVWVQDATVRGEETVCASSGNGQSLGTFYATREPGRTPYRRQPTQQSFGQLGDGNTQRALGYSLPTGEGERNVKVQDAQRSGYHRLIDFTVAEDHSYWTEGVFSHNCAEPNLQQQPFDVRAMYVAPEGWQYVEADLSQLEPRIMADLSGDPNLLRVYRDGLDLYKQVATALFSLPYDEINKHQRQVAKMVWLGRAYGVGAESLREQLANRGVHVTLPQASTFIRRLEQGFPILTEWQQRLIEEAERTGYVEEPFTGWRRYFWDKKVEAPKVRNWPNQAGGAAIVNDMMIQLDAELDWENEFMVAQIHDAITLLVRDARVDYWLERLPRVMSLTLPENGIPLLSEAQASRLWMDVK